MISLEEARIRVTRGAAHLDQVRPGWFNEIDVGTLALDSCTYCIAGQLAPHAEFPFREGLLQIGLVKGTEAPRAMNAVATSHGLATDEKDDSAFPLLQDAWIEAIAARRHPVVEREPELVTEGSR